MSVTVADVKVLIGPTGKTDLELGSFLSDAAMIVSEQLSGLGLSNVRLDAITKYLAAHFAVVSEHNGGVRRARLGESDESYVVPEAGKLGGFGATHFGQQALALDTTGKLVASQANYGLKAQLRVV